MGDLPMGAANGGVTVLGSSLMGTPAYRAGLGEGDVIATLDGMAVKSVETIAKILSTKRPGARVTATVRRHGRERTVDIALVADPRQEFVPVEQTGGTLTPAQKQFRDAWLGSRVR